MLIDFSLHRTSYKVTSNARHLFFLYAWYIRSKLSYFQCVSIHHLLVGFFNSAMIIPMFHFMRHLPFLVLLHCWMYSFILLTNTKSNAQEEVSCKVCMKKFKKRLIKLRWQANKCFWRRYIHSSHQEINKSSYICRWWKNQYPRGKFQLA